MNETLNRNWIFFVPEKIRMISIGAWIEKKVIIIYPVLAHWKNDVMVIMISILVVLPKVIKDLGWAQSSSTVLVSYDFEPRKGLDGDGFKGNIQCIS